MFAQIIPALRLPQKFSAFTYQIPNELAGQLTVGQLVLIPWRGQKISGIVWQIISETDVPANRLKKIEKIKLTEPLLSSEQLNLAAWLAEYYHVSLASIIKIMLPPLPQKKSNRGQEIVWADFQAKNIPLPKLPAKNFLQYFTVNYQQDFLFSFLASSAGQILMLFPELTDLAAAGTFLSPELRAQTVVWSGELNQNQLQNAWQKIKTGQAKIILGTRPAVFLPFKHLKKIVVVKETNNSHKQWDQNPRYDARVAAEKLAEIYQAQLLITAVKPRVETYQKILDGKINLIKELKPATALEIIIIDQAQERRGGNYSLLNPKLIDAITNAKQQNQKTFLHLNRLGEYRALTCADCKHQFDCSDCRSPLTPHQGGTLTCHRCLKKIPTPVSCPNCHGANFRFRGSGTEQLEKELKKLWPGLKILRLDAEQKIKKLSTASLPEADVYLGTDLAIRFLPWIKIKTIALLSLDQQLMLPDFRSQEKIWRQFNEISSLTNYQPDVKIYLATNQIDHSFWPILLQNQEEFFYQNELTNRQELNYPPFCLLVKLIAQGKNQPITEKSAWQVYELLTKKAKQDTIQLQINEPRPAATPLIRGNWRYLINLKINKPEDLASLWEVVPEDWLIDIEPEDLF